MTDWPNSATTDPGPRNRRLLLLLLLLLLLGGWLLVGLYATGTVGYSSPGQGAPMIDSSPPGGTFMGRPPASWGTTAVSGLSITGDTIASVYPGGPAVPIDLVFASSGGEAVRVTSVISQVVGTSADSCLPSWFSFTRSLTATVVVPAGETQSLSQLGVPSSSWPMLAMKETGTNQDACKGGTVTLSYTGRVTP